MRYALVPGLLVASLISLFLACLLGSTPISAGQVMSAVFGLSDASVQIIVWEIRLPRALAAWIAGAALGASGAALQGLLRNPLAEPGVLGVTACASLGAAFTIHYGLVAVFAFALPLGALAGALAATALIAFAAMKNHSSVALILAGIGLSSLATAVMALLMNLAPNPFTLSDMINWMLGSVANRSLADIRLSILPILIGMALLYSGRRGLSALTLGEEAAMGIGVDVKRVRILIVLGAGLATGGAVALAGAIGFVGIAAPHIIRPFVKHDSGRALVPSAILAGLILVLADIGVRLLPTTSELKLGVVAALLGAPVFVWIALQRRGLHE
ncbi:MAG: ABC transporter permease [Hirschia sp.]|mgnify:CR=1 FL=1|nr:ABC transporter permease [Hirschia sp.]MBF19842.1 ABC transporter permease [Hirschia sp.]